MHIAADYRFGLGICVLARFELVYASARGDPRGKDLTSDQVDSVFIQGLGATRGLEFPYRIQRECISKRFQFYFVLPNTLNL